MSKFVVQKNIETCVDQITSCTVGTRASIVFAFFLWIAYIARKKPKSRMLKSGEFGGWQIRRISNPPSLAASQKSGSSNFKWEGALSCWMNIGLPTYSLGHFALMAGNTWLIMKSLITSLVIDVMGFITKSPRTRPACSVKRKQTLVPAAFCPQCSPQHVLFIAKKQAQSCNLQTACSSYRVKTSTFIVMLGHGKL